MEEKLVIERENEMLIADLAMQEENDDIAQGEQSPELSSDDAGVAWLFSFQMDMNHFLHANMHACTRPHRNLSSNQIQTARIMRMPAYLIS